MSATKVVLHDCAPANCDRPDTLRFTLDATGFRKSVASAIYVDEKVPSKGSFLLVVTLPNGSTERFKAHYGGHVLAPLDARGSWTFDDGAQPNFRRFLNEHHQAVVIPARVQRNAQRAAKP